MTFEDRNNAWKGEARTFVQTNSRSSAPRVWMIKVEANRIVTAWGVLNGAMQEATEVLDGVNQGKKNAKTGAQYALERAREKSRKRHLEGYREMGSDGAMLDALVDIDIDFDDLPASLCFYKPENSMGQTMIDKAEDKKVWYSRKRNGLAFVLSRGKAHVRMYSRRMLRQHDDEFGGALTWNDRFPHIIEAANQIMPENSIILGELVMDRDGKDDFAAVQSYTKSLTLQSLQDQKRFGYPSFYIWDIAFWDGQDMVSKLPVYARYELIHELDYSKCAGALLPVEYVLGGSGIDKFPLPLHAVNYAKQQGFEGWVVVDPDGIYGDKAYNFKGKPDRPGKFCCKLKPSYEDDFVAIWDPENGYGERSTKARRDGGIKSVALLQYNSKGELVFISNCNSGLTDELLEKLAKPQLYPQVWKVEYKGRRYMSQGDKTNALDFPSLVEIRQDKKPEECINQEL